MEFTNTPRDIPPHRPVPGGGSQPAPQRRVFSDFAARPTVRPSAPQPRPAVPTPPIAPRPTPTQSIPAQAARPAASAFQSPRPVQQPLTPPMPTELDDIPEPPSHHETKSKAARSAGSHAGLVGFICFVVFATLLLSPFLPGKILNNFPGSSDTDSSGDQTIGCVDDVTNSTSSLAYNSKVGSPIVYNYSATMTQKALCDGQQKTAVEGRTSQFNPLGLAADLVLALAVAVGVVFVWRKIFRVKD